MNAPLHTASRIRELNDQLRTCFIGGRVLITEGITGTFHATNQGAVSWWEFARAIMAAAGHDPDRVDPIATHELDPPRAATRPANSVLDNMALRLHGLPPTRHFTEALDELVADLRELGRA